MRKWVMLALLLFLSACSSKPETIVETVAPVVETVETPVEPLVQAVAPVNDKEGRMIITIKDKLVRIKDVKSLTFTISGFEAHDENTGETVWKSLTLNTTQINLTEIGEKEKVIVDATVPAGKYTQMRFKISEVAATVGKTSYAVKIPDSKLLILGVVDVHGGKTAAATLDFNIEKSLHIVEGTAYLRPSIIVTTRREPSVVIENLIANISGGDVLTNREQSLNLTYPSTVLNLSLLDCRGVCGKTCSDEYTGCSGNCDAEVSAGCQSDESYCRKICEPLIHPFYCKYGCAILNGDDPEINDTIEACEDYLELGCAESCNTTRTDCDDACENECI